MAHIISCMLDSDSDDFSLSLNNYIAKEVSPQASNESLGRVSPTSTQSNKPFVWRMHQPERKYQLFPKDKPTAAAPGKSLDPEQAFALAMSQNVEKGEKSTAGAGLRIRIKEHNLIRRRKVSVPDLGPMTTVQEVAMDSPTIPGRPPLHERSISAPGTSWRQHHLAECMSLPRDQTLDERAEINGSGQCRVDQRSQNQPRQPLSPKSLAPLVIPPHHSTAPRLAHQISLSRLRSGSTPVESALRSAKTDDSPKTRTPFTPLSASIFTPKSAATSTTTVSTLPTPISAPIDSRSSPKPWEKPANPASVNTPKESSPEVSSALPKSEPTEIPRCASATGHRRNPSESGSIMERGRPRKRTEGSGASISNRSEPKKIKEAERRAFEQLPKGWKATDAVNMLSQCEVLALQRQALQQAGRFEVLRKEDVDNLSRELRQLDERTDYLRRTYTSLRAGRRNLHTRICQYLRSPRTAKFSHESMLKQEEALAELDASIEEWVTKLEQAENRRTRVRQKLLEHVSAAATLSIAAGSIGGVSESLQQAMGVRPLHPSCGAGNISTPPRSPMKTNFTPHSLSSSPSPQRVVAQVPSTILERPFSEEAACMSPKASAANGLRRAETIRVYADNDVYALLADVEDAFTKMSADDAASTKDASLLSPAERMELYRAQSQEALNGSPAKTSPGLGNRSNDKVPLSKTGTPRSVTPPAPAPVPVTEPQGGEFFLTSAVFKPPKRANTATS